MASPGERIQLAPLCGWLMGKPVREVSEAQLIGYSRVDTAGALWVMPVPREASLQRVARSGARGLVAAMAMTGTRTVTANLELLEKSPPEAILSAHGPRAVRRLPAGYRAAVTEFVHWLYGAGGGVAFGFFPLRIRSVTLTGPLYGIAVWLVFEFGIAPLLGVRHVRERRLLGRLVVAADHAL